MAQGKRFAPEFRQKAVRLYRVSGKPFRVVAEELQMGFGQFGSGKSRHETP